MTRTTIRDQFDIDSMDFLNFLVSLNDSLDIGAPESDYVKGSTLRGCFAHLSHRLPQTRARLSTRRRHAQ
jgi:acyl carrier protein